MNELERVRSHLNVITPGAAVYVPPLVLAYGLGVDSTAALAGWHARGIRPAAITFADVSAEKRETYDFLPVINEWLAARKWPEVTVVRNVVGDFRHWPPYQGLLENCLTNATLPSLAFGFKSCSLKHKVTPQNKWAETWGPAQECWALGHKVRKAIGYDASPKDRKRFAHAVGVEDPAYEYFYPLIEWGWDRARCKEEILAAGLPVPPKSACVFCPATQPQELREFRKSYLRTIVIMEARAKPRLMGCWNQEQIDAYNAETMPKRLAKWEKKSQEALAAGKPQPSRPNPYKVGDGTAGLWRSATKTKPAMMTDFIVAEGLLPEEEVRMLQERAPKEIIDNQQAFANGEEIPNWHDFLEQFSPEDALDEVPGACGGCQMISV